ncbi:hypothetical protein NPIL_270481 [Nephila pilipes]|uniref:Uncharacterized protein n=1 Tax=Nephila pilipes TaxID=299642 RepID=A0A8X6N4Y0_NEPPI|nr:hypothetical protein NPIL_270481 [Nephila pilipes]
MTNCTAPYVSISFDLNSNITYDNSEQDHLAHGSIATQLQLRDNCGIAGHIEHRALNAHGGLSCLPDWRSRLLRVLSYLCLVIWAHWPSRLPYRLKVKGILPEPSDLSARLVSGELSFPCRATPSVRSLP